MAKRITIVGYRSVPAGGSGRLTLWTVEPAMRFKVCRVELLCSSGTDLRLGVRLMYGDERVAPENDWLRADPGRGIAEVEFEYGGESKVDVVYENFDTTTSRSFFVMVHGVVE